MKELQVTINPIILCLFNELLEGSLNLDTLYQRRRASHSKGDLDKVQSIQRAIDLFKFKNKYNTTFNFTITQ